MQSAGTPPCKDATVRACWYTLNYPLAQAVATGKQGNRSKPQQKAQAKKQIDLGMSAVSDIVNYFGVRENNYLSRN